MSTERPKTREELYERIRQGRREEFILEDMIRLGFWPARGELPHDPAEEIHRRAELQRELAELRSEHRRLYNEEALLKEMRKRRLAESRRREFSPLPLNEAPLLIPKTNIPQDAPLLQMTDRGTVVPK